MNQATLDKLSPEKRRLLELMLAERKAKKLEQRRAAKAEIVPVDRDGVLPPSYAQQRLWFLDQLAPGNPAYNIPAAVRLTGVLDGDLLARSLQSLVDRHENLRTNFVSPDGKPRMEIHDTVDLPLERVDLSHLSPEEALEEAQNLVPKITNRPFNLSRGALVRVALMRLAPNDHVLLLIMHHIISDVWSFGIFFKELGAVYDALVAGEEPSLPPLPFHYADYAVWQRKVLESGEHERQLGFWKEQLQGAPTVLDLPTDRPRPLQQRFLGGRVPLVFGGPVPGSKDANLNDALRELARGEDATLYMANLSVLAILLKRLSGQEELLIGTPVTNRSRTELEAQIGFYVNSLAIRAELQGDPTYRELLARVRDRCLPAFEHRDLPFERLVQELKIERDMGRNPVYQVDFAFQNFPKPYLKTPGLTLSPFEMREAAARVDLEFDLKESTDGFEGFIRFNSDLFDKGTVERLAERFENLLRAALANPDAPISSLRSITDAEETRITTWNETAASFDGAELPIHRLFERQVRETPDAVALVSHEETLTYRELDRRADGLAHRLRRAGLGVEDRCGVCLQRSNELLVALLAVFKAGAAYVPLDPDYPKDRLGFMVEDAAVKGLIGSAESLAKLGDLRKDPNLAASNFAEVAVLEIDAASLAEEAVDDGAPEVPGHGVDHLAYVIFTSGSTGRPKGAMNSHRGPVNRLLWGQENLPLGPGDKVLIKTPFSFDVSVWEMFQPLIGGATLVLAKAGGQGDPAYLAELIDAHGVTLIHSVPSMLQVFVDTVPDGSCASLKRVVASGEALPFELQRRFYARFDAELHNLYGPTETAIEVTAWHCRRDAVSGPVPMGGPVSNLRMHVVDDAFGTAGIGVPGELLIAGVGVGRGYHDRPALTAERFVPDPFADEPGARLYRTGDKARWLADGTLEFLGRLDHQVKIRGFRIELGEIENALMEHTSVQDAAVLVRKIAGTPALVGYLVPTQTVPVEGASVDLDALRRHLLQSLPDYMVPAAWVELDVFPLTPSGKLDRRALPDPQAVVEEYVAPREGTEAALAEIWQEVLDIDRVGAADNFFNLGGQSLLATQVVARIRDVLGADLPVRTLFEKSELRELAGAVERASSLGQATADAPPMVAQGRDQALPLSFAQERLWFIDQLVPDLAAYNIPGAVRMTGELDPELLEEALNLIVDRHEVLRTTFAGEGGRAMQRVAPAGGPRWTIPRLDLRDLPRAEREVEAYRVANELSAQPFNLATGPLMRGTLIRLEDRSWFFALIIHHIVYDMWSRDIFLGELVAIYEALRQGRAPMLPEMPLQYADFAVWQREWLQGEVLEQQLDYWRRELDGVEPFELPADHARPQVQTFAGRRLHFSLSRDLTERLKSFSRKSGVTLFVTLLSGFAILLERYTGRRDLAIGSPVANRNRTEIEGLMGFFANTLVLRARLEPEMTVSQLLAHVQDMTLGAYSHQDLPFEKLVNEIQPNRDLSRQPLFQVLFNYLINYVPPAIELPGLRLDPEQIHGGGVPFDLTLSLYEVDGSLKATADYATDIFEEATMTRFFQHYDQVLDGLARSLESTAGADLPIDAIDALGLEERRLLLAEGASESVSETASTGSSAEAVTVADRVAEQAGRTPDGIALVAHDGEDGAEQSLTYAELMERADRLASYLLGLGVRLDEPVALAMERRLDLPVAALAVLRAGGAYLPLDPSAPRERLDFIVEDADVRVVLTTSDLAERFAGLVGDDGHVVALDRLDLDTPSAPESMPIRPLPRADRDGLAYVLFTSGSTGRPKGVAMTHRAVLGLIDWQVRDLQADGLGEGLRTLQFASIGFDVSFEEIFSTWASGGSLHMLREDERRDMQAVVSRLATDRIERVILPAVALQELSQLSALPSTPQLSLKRIATSGEQLHVTDELRSLAARLGAGDGELVLDNEYGPSETHVVTRYRLEGDPASWPTLPPIGKAIDGVRLYIVDRRGEPVPLGVAGELIVGGAAPARGYLGRPELTAEVFGTDTFAAEAGLEGRVYRTGDLVRRRADGEIEFLGRLDDQVKIRGFRVEPGEVQSVLDGHPDLRQNAVVARQDGGSTRLVAYVVAEDGAEAPDVTTLRAYLGERLPDYMVPSAFVVLDALPINANGKVDRKALPEPDAARPDLAASYVAPQGEVEEKLAAIWQDVLGLEKVGAHDSFFELGGHSLLATQVVLRLSDTFDVDLPLRRLFDRPTISHLAQAVEAARWALEAAGAAGVDADAESVAGDAGDFEDGGFDEEEGEL